MYGTLLPKIYSSLDVALIMAASGESMAKRAHSPLREAPTASNWGRVSEMDKEAFVGSLMRAGRSLAGRVATRGGRTGQVGQQLLRPIRSPVRSPVGSVRAAPPVPTPPVRQTVAPTDAARTSAKPVRRTHGKRTIAKEEAAQAATARAAGGRKSLVGALAAPTLLVGGSYGLAKGVPAAAQFATEAGRRPMAHGLGFQQYAYGYPSNRAPF